VKKALAIVQNKPTQFDVPLYEFLQGRQAFNLVVYYTETHLQGLEAYDDEIGRTPRWDHLSVESTYARRDITAKEADDPSAVANIIASRNPDLVILCGYFPRLHRQLVWPLKNKGLRVGLRSDNTLRHSRFHGSKGFVKHLVLPFWLGLISV
jgi:hypothetical protein